MSCHCGDTQSRHSSHWYVLTELNSLLRSRELKSMPHFPLFFGITAPSISPYQPDSATSAASKQDAYHAYRLHVHDSPSAEGSAMANGVVAPQSVAEGPDQPEPPASQDTESLSFNAVDEVIDQTGGRGAEGAQSTTTKIGTPAGLIKLTPQTLNADEIALVVEKVGPWASHALSA
jgi:hypothetical protein